LIKMERLGDIPPDVISRYHVIGIDEAQFFTDIVDVIHIWLAMFPNIKIVIAGLDGDIHQRKFGTFLDLIPIADSCVKLSSKCSRCMTRLREKYGENYDTSRVRDALFTTLKRKDTNPDVIRIGGDDLYIPVCRACLMDG